MAVSGTGMVEATVLDAINEVKYYHGGSFEGLKSSDLLPRLNIDVPHAVISFVVCIISFNTSIQIFHSFYTDYGLWIFIVKNKSDSSNVEKNQKILAQVVGLTMWKLSEETFFKWNPKHFSEMMYSALTNLNSNELKEPRGNILKFIYCYIIQKTELI